MKAQDVDFLELITNSIYIIFCFVTFSEKKSNEMQKRRFVSENMTRTIIFFFCINEESWKTKQTTAARKSASGQKFIYSLIKEQLLTSSAYFLWFTT